MGMLPPKNMLTLLTTLVVLVLLIGLLVANSKQKNLIHELKGQLHDYSAFVKVQQIGPKQGSFPLRMFPAMLSEMKADEQRLVAPELRNLTGEDRVFTSPVSTAQLEQTGTTATAVFHSYHPSSYEKMWTEHVASWQAEACKHVHMSDATSWLHQVDGRAALHTATEAPPKEFEGSILSRFTYRMTDGRFAHVLIEPTGGILKDPRKCLRPRSLVYKQSKEYLVPLSLSMAKAIGHSNRRRPDGSKAKAILFDAGATLPSRDSNQSHYQARFKTWTGTEYIYEMYKNRGIVFDEIYAWEPSVRGKINITASKQAMSPRLAAALNFFQRGVSGKPGHVDNPLTLIASLCTPADICVFKLDVDSTDVEYSLVAQLLFGDPQVRDLVDDFYFEHHVVYGRPEPINNLDSWYAMAGYARHSGLRMHYWP